MKFRKGTAEPLETKSKYRIVPPDVVDYAVRSVAVVYDSVSGLEFQVLCYGAPPPVPLFDVYYRLYRRGVSADFVTVADVPKLCEDMFDHSGERGLRPGGHRETSTQHFFTPGLGRHDEVRMAAAKRGSIRR